MDELQDVLPTFAATSGVFTAVGIAIVLAGIFSKIRARRFDQRAIRVRGLVVDLRLRQRSGGQHASWFPILAFHTVEGHPIQTVAMYGSTPAPARPGQQVTVLYDPDQPTKARLDGGPLVSGGCMAAAVMVFGVMLTLLGLLIGAMTLLLWWGSQ